MRLWSLHPSHLDTKGLVALWREALLAKHVLEGKTKGYRNHPQLDRFKKARKPIKCINQYLAAVYEEAVTRGYKFNREKIDWSFRPSIVIVTRGQLDYEISHLLRKLRKRDRPRYQRLLKLSRYKPHPSFKVVPGAIEDWEIR